MHLEYTSLHLARFGPQVLPAILAKANSWVLSFLFTAWPWSFHDSFRSNQTLRNRAKVVGFTILYPRLRVPAFGLGGLASRSACDYCLRPLLKWISSLLVALNAMPLVSAHCRHVSQASSSCLALASGHLPKASRLVSSAKPTIPRCGCRLLRVLYKVPI